MTTIDLNADIGEGYGAYSIGSDAELMDIISSANIACGFHGGDPSIMDATIKLAMERGVRMGAHPGFNDLAGFGRRVIRGNTPEEIKHMIVYQVGAFEAMARANGGTLHYVKLHGALSNLAMVEPPLAHAFLAAMGEGKFNVPVMAMPFSAVERLAEPAGVAVIKEAFADRAYSPDGMLLSRQLPGAIIHDAEEAANRVLRMIDDRCIIAHDGKKLEADIDSICIHGDNPAALRIAVQVRNLLEKAGLKISSKS